MSERIEWIEPDEAAREYRRHEATEALRLAVCRALLALLGGVFASLVLAKEMAYLVGLIGLASLASVCAMLFISAILRDMKQGETTCTLDAGGAEGRCGGFASRVDWSAARSFEIADHPTRPGIRTLTIHREDNAVPARFFFREGQLDESELRAFVEARIAEPIAQRLMRRVSL